MKHSTRITRGLLAVVISSGLTATGATSAYGHLDQGIAESQSAEREGEPGLAMGSAEASARDVRVLSKVYDASPSQTLEHVENSRTFAALSTGWREQFVDSFAGAAFGERPGEPAMLRFVDDPPKEVLRQVDELPFKVVVGGGAKYTAREQHSLAVKTHDVLRERGFDQVAVAPEPDGSFTATAWSKGGATVPDLPVEVEVDVVDEPLAADLHSRGGGNVLDGGFRECTSGFAVQTPAGTTGIATAGHCNGLDQYQEPDTLVTYDMDYEQGHYGYWGDYEWHTTPSHIDPAQYFARTGEIRDVNSVSGWLPVGTPTCLFGQTSDVRWCDTIKYQDVVATFSGPAHHYLTLNTGSQSQPGDSGGPVSFSTEADGLIKGYMTKGGQRRDVWVRASLMPIAIGVSVRTQ